MKKISIVLLLISIIFLISCGNKAKEYEYTLDEVFSVMPYIRIQSDIKINDSDILNDINKILKDLDDKFNINKEASLINKVNNSSIDNKIKCDEEFIDVLSSAIKVSEKTKIDDKALYDVTIYPVFNYWNFNNRYYSRSLIKYDIEEIIDEDTLNDLLKLVNYKYIIIEDDYVYLSEKGAKIDLGSIVKGYACDKVREYLVNIGVNAGIINIGGNILCFGYPVKNNNISTWNVGIATPFNETLPNDMKHLLYYKCEDYNTFVTSGIYERYIMGDDDIMYHHIISPITGYPIDNELASVTVLGNISSMEADALSTAIFALGLSDGLNYANENNISCIFISKDKKIYFSNSVNEDNIVFNDSIKDYVKGEKYE